MKGLSEVSEVTEGNAKHPIVCWSAPARVLACLHSDRIRVVLCPGQGLADGGVPYEIEASLIPIDLRMPNSEFVVLSRRDTGQVVKVLRKDESLGDSEFVVDES
jgi:hypothetical protein